MGLTRQSRTHGINNTNTKSTPLHAISKSENSVGGFTALTDKDDNIVSEDWGLSIKEVAGKFDANRYLGQLLENSTSGQARMVTGPACDEYHTPGAADDREVGTKPTEGNLVLIEVDTSTHRVDDGLGLLVNLFLHESIEFAFHDGCNFKFQRLDVSSTSDLARSLLALVLASQTMNMKFSIGDVCDIIVLEVEDTLCVLDNGCSIRCYKKLNGLW